MGRLSDISITNISSIEKKVYFKYILYSLGTGDNICWKNYIKLETEQPEFNHQYNFKTIVLIIEA